MISLIERYKDQIHGVTSCYDRILIQGTLPGFCFAEGITRYFNFNGIRIFDYPEFAKPLRDRIRDNAERIANEAGITIQFIRKSSTRKEALVEEILKRRGMAPGLLCILSAMEVCDTYQPWHDKKTGNTYLRADSGKCLHFYFYFIHDDLGLCHVRVPTWCPFRLQFYFNGHSALASKLRKAGITYRMLDNAFLEIGDFSRAQAFSDDLDIKRLHALLDEFASRFCPVAEALKTQYHWSIMQAENATDIIFKDRESLKAIYDNLIRTAIHTIKPEKVATFLGRKLDPRFQEELGGDFSTRIEGTCVKHHMGPVSIKMYDKHGLILRIETTVNDVTFFKHHRKVEHRDGTRTYQFAPMKKSIYSLPFLDNACAAANRRYIAFLSEIDNPSAGRDDLDRVSSPRKKDGKNYRGINFFCATDQELLHAISRGQHLINGFRSKDIRRYFPLSKAGWFSRSLKRLRIHGMIRRAGRTYKYYLTQFGKRIVATGQKLIELFLVPQLASA